MRKRPRELGGGIIWRKVPDGSVEVALVFHGGDWELPKGRPNVGESNRETAIREVEEETQQKVVINEFVGGLADKGQNKVIWYWTMEIVGAAIDFVPTKEIKKFQWFPYLIAMARLKESEEEVMAQLLHMGLDNLNLI